MARKSTQEMLGEFLREAAVLILVFGFLEPVLKDDPVTMPYALGVVLVSGIFLVSGIRAERRRKEEKEEKMKEGE